MTGASALAKMMAARLFMARLCASLLYRATVQMGIFSKEYLIRAMADVRGKLVIVRGGPLRGKSERLASDEVADDSAARGVRDRILFRQGVNIPLPSKYHPDCPAARLHYPCRRHSRSRS
jgi:hypothetical protein